MIRALGVVGLAVLVLLAGCAPAGLRNQPAPVLVVGAAPDRQSVLLANIYAAALRSYGARARVESAADPLTKLDSGAFDVLPSFTGLVLAALAPEASVRSDAQVYRAMVGALPEGVAAGDYATAAEDKPALAVSQTTIQAWGGADLSLLAAQCDRLLLGTVAGVRTVPALGRCQLPAAAEFHSAATLFAAVRTGQLSAGWTSTADPEVPADLVVLADAKPALVQAENVVPLYRRNELTDRQLLAINEVAGLLDTAALVEMSRQVARGADAAAVAVGWLAEHPLGR